MSNRQIVGKGWGRLVAGILLSAALIALLLRNVVWADLAHNIASFPWWAVLTSGGIVLLSVPLRTIQWYLLLGEWPQLTWRKVFSASCLGHVGNIVLPMRGGELVKTGMLARSASMPLERVLASIVLCRFQDLFPIGGIFLFFLLNANLPAMEVQLGLEPGALGRQLDNYGAKAPWIAGVVFVLAVLAIAVAVRWHLSQPWRVSSKNSRIYKWAIERANSVVGGLRAAGNPVRFLGAILATLGCWVLFTLASVPLLLSLGIPWLDALHGALIITGATTFFQLLPSAPTAAGTFHLGCTLALASAAPQLDAAQALAFAIVLHGVGTLAPALPGILLIPALFRSNSVSRFGKLQ